MEKKKTWDGQYIKPVILWKIGLSDLISSHQTLLYENNNFKLENIWKMGHSYSETNSTGINSNRI